MSDLTPPPEQDPFSKPARARRARVLAIQFLYQVTISNQTTSESLESFSDDHLKGMKGRKTDRALFMNLITFLEQYPEKVEETLTAALQPKWSLSKLETVLQAILRIGVAEILLGQTAHKILLNEYVQITQGFFEQGQEKLVNATLDQICKQQ